MIGEGEQIKEWGEYHRPRLFCAATKWILLKTNSEMYVVPEIT